MKVWARADVKVGLAGSGAGSGKAAVVKSLNARMRRGDDSSESEPSHPVDD